MTTHEEDRLAKKLREDPRCERKTTYGKDHLTKRLRKYPTCGRKTTHEEDHLLLIGRIVRMEDHAFWKISGTEDL